MTAEDLVYEISILRIKQRALEAKAKPIQAEVNRRLQMGDVRMSNAIPKEQIVEQRAI